VIPPEAPTGGLIRQAVFDDEADGRGDDPPGVVAAGCGPVGAGGVEVLAALRAEVLGVGQNEVAGPPGDEVTEVVEGSLEDPVAVGAVVATRAGSTAIVAAAVAELGLGQILDAGDAFGGVGQIFSGTGHGAALLWVVSLQENTRIGPVRFVTEPGSRARHSRFLRAESLSYPAKEEQGWRSETSFG
jgi:hypothetical protein